MIDFLDYDWLRAGHLVSVISWMAAMLMFPRLQIYRLEGAGNSGLEAMMDQASTRLRHIIMTPSMSLTWVFGLLLAVKNWDYLSTEIFFWVKIVGVILLSGIHGMFVSMSKKIAAGTYQGSIKTLRMINEIPILIAIVLVIMVVVEPF